MYLSTVRKEAVKGEALKGTCRYVCNFPILSRFFSQRFNGAPGHPRSNGSNRPPRPARCAAMPPGYYGLAVLPAQLHLMSNFRLTGHSDCFSLQTKPLRKRDIRGSWAIPPASQQGAFAQLRGAGRVSIVYVCIIVVFSVRLRPDDSGLRNIFSKVKRGQTYNLNIDSR